MAGGRRILNHRRRSQIFMIHWGWSVEHKINPRRKWGECQKNPLIFWAQRVINKPMSDVNCLWWIEWLWEREGNWGKSCGNSSE
jgi:hypothetical protein